MTYGGYMCLCCQYFLLLVMVLFLSACQGGEEKSTSTAVPSTVETETSRSVKKREAAPPEKRETEAVKVVEKKIKKIKKEAAVEIKEKAEEAAAAKVDLKVSGDYLQKIDEESEDYLATPPKSGEAVTENSRKIEVSGGVILNDKEKDLIKKLDGGEVEISIPIN